MNTICSKLSWSFSRQKAIVLEHAYLKIKKAAKGVNLIHKLNLSLPWSSFLTVFKSFIRLHLDYGDFVYDQLNLFYLTSEIESVQYNAALVITVGIRGTSKEKLYPELGFESLRDR